MANSARSSCKRKDDDSNSLKRKQIGGKSSTTSGSMSTDTSGLRRSARGTPSKKHRASSPSNTRKSEGIETRSRRSHRFEKGSSSLETDNKNEKREKNGKQRMLDNEDQRREETSHPKPRNILQKKRLMDARCYRERLYRGKHKRHPEESHESKRGDETPVSSNSPDEVIANETVGDTDSVFDTCGAVAGDKIGTSNTDDVSSSPSGSKRSDSLGICVGYSKRRRVNLDSQNCDVHPCNSKKNHDLCDTFPKEVCEQANILRSPKNNGIPVSCIQKDGSIEDVNLMAKKIDDADLDGSELLPEAHRNVVHDNSDEHAMAEVPVISEEDGEEFETRVSTGHTEECCNDKQLNESPSDFQTKTDHNACFICKLDGNLLCCDGNGCSISCHHYCLDPPLNDVPSGVWHCLWCVKKKIESGVHSVSGGMESIWDAREGEVSNCRGMQKQNHYLVKYKGLAHAHNRWVSEDQLLLEAPMLVAEFKKNQVLKWKSEWSKPHRLLRKRLLMSPKQHDEYLSEHCSDTSNCHYEWLVKWTGLGYEHATWELENASFLRSPEALTLIRDYECRREKAKRASDPRDANKGRKGSFLKLSKLPGIGLPGVDNDHLSFVNKLREYWHKGQNVIIEDQERVFKVILFILSLQSHACRPFLIISTSSALSVWEAEFLRLAPSLNVVVYNGNKDVRESIRALEFYEESGCIMFEVLLSPPDAIVEDLDLLECVGWEAIIVDECQHFGASNFFDQIKTLTTEFRLLLICGQIKDSIPEYLNLLSFIDSGGDGNGFDNLKTDSNDIIGKLKERFAQFAVCERKSDSSKFVEYWVPVRLSHVQVEQYCATLLSNSTSLRSCSKNDPVGALCDILISSRKCCDHPYLVNESLQSLLTKDLPEVEYLEVGVNASGKLQVLDKVLQEIRKRGLRVLILFQSISGSGRNSIGDILDDFLRQRFGLDTYERVDSGLVMSKKQAALNMFNNKERGRFAFLIENRACLPSIKLSSVDVVILFDSDWNPLNDIRALQKITIDSQFEQIKVFRLYSSCTVEEKVLILAKQHTILDSNIQNINCGTSHALLIWGASYLFKKLDEFHSSGTHSSSSITSKQSFLNEVSQELLTQLPHDAENDNKSDCSIIVKVQQSGGMYPVDVSLLGEVEIQSSDEELPHVFWTDLLKDRHPQWRYSSGPSPRVRKRVKYFEESPKKSEVERDEVIKKHKKVVNTHIDVISPKSVEDERRVFSMDKQGDSCHPDGNGAPSLPRSTTNMNAAGDHMAKEIPEQPEESEEKRNFHDSQKNLHHFLKPKILKLCEILQLPEDVKSMAGRFLGYVMKNHHVNREPATILEAFQISMCWSAVSLLKHKISRKESLAVAKQRLNFECKEEEVRSVYSKLRWLKQMFSDRAELVLGSNSAEDSTPRTKEVANSQSMASDEEDLEEGEIRESSKSLSCSAQSVSSKQDQAVDSGKVDDDSLKNVSYKSIRKVLKIHSRRMRKLLEKQIEEFEEFNKNREQLLEEEKAKLEKKRKLESALIRAIHGKTSIGLGKLKMVDEDFARKMEEFNHQMERQQRKLEAVQLVASEKENLLKAHWLEEAKSGRPVDLFACLPLPESGFRVEDMEDDEQGGVSDDHEKGTSMTAPSSEHGSDDLCPVVPEELVSGGQNGGMDTMALERETVAGEEQQSREEGSDNGCTPSLEPTRADAQQLPASTQDDREDGSDHGCTPSLEPTRANTQQLTAFTQDDRDDGSDNGCTPSLEPTRANSPLAQQITASTQDDQEDGSDNGCTLSLEPTRADSPLAQQLTAYTLDDQVPSAQAPSSEHPQQSIAAEVQGENISGCEEQNPLHQVEVPSVQPAVTTPLHQPNHETTVLSAVLQSQPPASTDPLPTEDRQLDMPEPTGMEQEQIQQSQPPVEGQVEQFNHSGQPHDTEVQQAQVLTQAVDNSQLRNHSVSLPNMQSQPHLFVDTHLGGRIRSDPRNTGIVPESSNRSPQTAHVTSRVPQFFHSDPLQNELARILREEDQAIKMHKDVTTRLNSECETEIEEIRRKYNSLQQDAATMLVQKRKALETIYNKVFLNRLLAEAFKFKLSDVRVGAPGVRQGTQTGFVHQLSQLSSQQNAHRPIPASTLSAVSPATPPVQVVHHSAALFSSHSVRPNISPNIPSNPVRPSPNIPSNPVRLNLTPNIPSNLVRPNISPNIPPWGSNQASSEIRSPAPHLQHLRPSTSISAPGLPPVTSVVPSQQSHSVPAATPRAPTYPPGPFNRMQQQESSGWFPVAQNSSSALELLRDVDNRPGANPPSVLPPLTDLGLETFFDTWGMSELATTGNLRGPGAPMVTAADNIVCLSDDD